MRFRAKIRHRAQIASMACGILQRSVARNWPSRGIASLRARIAMKKQAPTRVACRSLVKFQLNKIELARGCVAAAVFDFGDGAHGVVASRHRPIGRHTVCLDL